MSLLSKSAFSFKFFKNLFINKTSCILLHFLKKQMDSSLLVIAAKYHLNQSHYQRAKEFFEMAAYDNNAEAFFGLGNIYFNGWGVEHDYQKAKEFFEKAIEKGNSHSIWLVGMLYYNGTGVTQDYLKTKEYFEKVIDSSQQLFFSILYKISILRLIWIILFR